MTEKLNPQGAAALWIAAVVIVFALVMIRAVDVKQAEVHESCMDNVVTPDPEAVDYDDQALEFGIEIRRCMRG